MRKNSTAPNSGKPKYGVLSVRISKNDLKDGHGTDAQLRVLRGMAARDGVTIVHECVEENISGWKRNVKRPKFDMLIEQLPEVDVWYAWTSDRITRRCDKIEELITLLDKLYNRPRGFEVRTHLGGMWDINDPADRLRIRIGGAISEYESDVKSERAKLRHEELALEGLSAGGWRPFGYKGYRAKTDKLPERKNGMEIEPSEAAEIQWMFDRVLAGDSVCSITRQLNARGVATTTGECSWRTATVKGILRSPRVIGLRQHNGKLHKAAWPAIISPDVQMQALALIDNGHASTNPGRERKLLSAIAICGRCGAPLRARHRSSNGRLEYTCRRLPGENHCNRLGIGGDELNKLAERMLFSETSPDEFDAANRESDDPSTALADALAELDERERQAGVLFVSSPLAAEAAMNEIAEQRVKLMTKMADGVVARRAPINLAEVKAKWNDYTIEQKRGAIQSRFRAIVIRPGRGPVAERARFVGIDESEETLSSLIGD